MFVTFSIDNAFVLKQDATHTTQLEGLYLRCKIGKSRQYTKQ